MGQIRVWEVGFQESETELFGDLDVALAYVKSELRAGREAVWLESWFMDEAEYKSWVEVRDGGVQ